MRTAVVGSARLPGERRARERRDPARGGGAHFGDVHRRQRRRPTKTARRELGGFGEEGPAVGQQLADRGRHVPIEEGAVRVALGVHGDGRVGGWLIRLPIKIVSFGRAAHYTSGEFVGPNGKADFHFGGTTRPPD